MRALLHAQQVALQHRVPDDERMRLPATPRRQSGNTRVGAVIGRMVGEHHVGVGLLRQGAEPGGLYRIRRQSRAEPSEVEARPAPRRDHVRLLVVAYREDRGNCSFGVPRRQVQRHREIAEGESHAVGRHHVSLRLPGRVGAVEQVVVGRAHHQPGAIGLLQILCSGGVITVPVADDDVLDVRRIQPELLQSALDLDP